MDKIKKEKLVTFDVWNPKVLAAYKHGCFWSFVRLRIYLPNVSQHFGI